MKPLAAGKLTKRLQIQQLPTGAAAPAPNRANEPDLLNSWKTTATVWGGIEPVTGREILYASVITSDTTHLVTIRYFPGLTPAMRFKHIDTRTKAARLFQIRAVLDPEEKHVQMVCGCVEQTT